MILTDIKRYMVVHRRATLGDLALHFKVDADAMRGMLEVWILKGKLAELESKATCNTSCPLACADTAMTVYEWTDGLPITRVERPAVSGTCRQTVPLSKRVFSGANLLAR